MGKPLAEKMMRKGHRQAAFFRVHVYMKRIIPTAEFFLRTASGKMGAQGVFYRHALQHVTTILYRPLRAHQGALQPMANYAS
jgi:hypothetical protein